MIWYWEILFEITATKKVTKPDKVELRDFYCFCVKMIRFFFVFFGFFLLYQLDVSIP